MRRGRSTSLGSGLQRAITSLGGREHADKARVAQVWQTAVGEEVARHTYVKGVERGRLMVAVDSSVWATQLQVMSDRLKECINEEIGRELVRTIKFNVSQAVEKDRAEEARTEQARRGYGGQTVTPIELSKDEMRAARKLVEDIENPEIKDAALGAIVAEKEWEKGRHEEAAE